MTPEDAAALSAQLEIAVAALGALEQPPEGQPRGAQRDIDEAAQAVIDLREQLA